MPSPSRLMSATSLEWFGKCAHTCKVHEVMTYEARVQAQRSAIQPWKQHSVNSASQTWYREIHRPTEMLLIPFFSLPWISLICLAHAQFSMKDQPSLGPLHPPYFSIIKCLPKHIEKQNPPGAWRMKEAERPRPTQWEEGEAWNPHNSINTYWKSESHSVMSDCDPMDYTVHGILQARILEWVAFPFSRGSSQPRDQTQVSCIAGRFFTSWATKEAQISTVLCSNAPNNTTWYVLHLLLLLFFTRCLTLRTLFHIPVLPFLLWTIKTIKFISEGQGQVYMG